MISPSIAICATIHEGEERRQNFGMVQKAFIRCLNAEGEKEIARYDLSEDSSTETAMIFGELYRAGAEWKFWPGPQSCAGSQELATTAGSLFESLPGTRAVRCDEAAWRFAGLSFAGWNVIARLRSSSA